MKSRYIEEKLKEIKKPIDMEGINQSTQKTLALDTGAKGETVITKANKEWLDQKSDNDK